MEIFIEFFEKLLNLFNPHSDDFILKIAFIPNLDRLNPCFKDFEQVFRTKFPLLGTSIDFLDSIKGNILQVGEKPTPPKFELDLKGIYGSPNYKVKIIDFSFYEPYREYVNSLISLIAIFNFVFLVIRKVGVVFAGTGDTIAINVKD